MNRRAMFGGVLFVVGTLCVACLIAGYAGFQSWLLGGMGALLALRILQVSRG